jgi:glucosamine-6-phosphate deaminase
MTVLLQSVCPGPGLSVSARGAFVETQFAAEALSVQPLFWNRLPSWTRRLIQNRRIFARRLYPHLITPENHRATRYAEFGAAISFKIRALNSAIYEGLQEDAHPEVRFQEGLQGLWDLIGYLGGPTETIRSLDGARRMLTQPKLNAESDGDFAIRMKLTHAYGDLRWAIRTSNRRLIEKAHDAIYEVFEYGLVMPATVIGVEERPDIGPIAAQMLYDDIAAFVLNPSPNQTPTYNVILPADRTCEGTFRVFLELLRQNPLDLSRVRFFYLDDYIGTHLRFRSSSLRAQAKRALIEPLKQLNERLLQLNFRREYVDNFNYDAPDVDVEIQRYRKRIDDLPVIHFALLGIGANTHFGFNERGSSFTSRVRKILIDLATRRQNAELFDGNWQTVPEWAGTIGIGPVMRSLKIVQLVATPEKIEAARDTLEGPITEDRPSSVFRMHGSYTMIIDRAARARLRPEAFRHHYQLVAPPATRLDVSASIAKATPPNVLMKGIRGILFDWDGTLSRSGEIDEEIITFMYAELDLKGHERPATPIGLFGSPLHQRRVSEIPTQKGKPILETFKLLAERFPLNGRTGESLLAVYEKHYQRFYDEVIRLHHEVLMLSKAEETLRKLRLQHPDLPIFLVTGPSEESIHHRLSLVDLESEFTGVVAGLPKRQAFQMIYDRYEWGNGEALIIGDTAGDLDAAPAQHRIGVTASPDRIMQLYEAGADAVVPHLGGLEILKTEKFNIVAVRLQEDDDVDTWTAIGRVPMTDHLRRLGTKLESVANATSNGSERSFPRSGA